MASNANDAPRPPERVAEAVWRAVERLNPDELLKLKRHAEWYVRNAGRKAAGNDWRDLLHNSMLSLAAGVRSWDVARFDLCSCLIGVMRSKANGLKQKAGIEMVPAAYSSGDPENLRTLDELTESAENTERQLRAHMELERIFCIFRDRSPDFEILQCLSLGLNWTEIRRTLKISEREQRNAVKRIRTELAHWGYTA